jgi:hypothetical protein
MVVFGSYEKALEAITAFNTQSTIGYITNKQIGSYDIDGAGSVFVYIYTKNGSLQQAFRDFCVANKFGVVTQSSQV